MLKKILIILSSFFITLFIAAFLAFVFLIPSVLTKKNLTFSAFNNQISIQNIKTKADLKLNYKILADKVVIEKKDGQKLILKELALNFSPIFKKSNQLTVQNLTFNKTHFERSYDKNNFDLFNLPETYIKKGQITLLNPDKSTLEINLSDFSFLKSNNKLNFNFKGDIKTPNLSLLTYPKRNFGDNFKNYFGIFQGNLIYSKNNLDGFIQFEKLSATCIPLTIPIEFQNAVFNFDKKSIYLSEIGLFGGEKAKTEFYLTDIFAKQKETAGTVSADISNAFSKKYIDYLYIKNKISLDVEYYVKNGVANVFYYAKLPIGSDVYYHGTRLGLIQKERKFQAITRKAGDKIDLLKYSYAVKSNGQDDEIIFGSAEFTKKNGKFSIDKISGETKKDAPVSLLGFLENRLVGGVFNGILEYNFNSHKLLGSISLSDTVFKDFKISDAIVTAKDSIIDVFGAGIFEGSPFSVEIALKNSLNEDLYITLLDLYLKKYVAANTYQADLADFDVQEFDKFDFNGYKNITADKITIRLDKFIKDKIVIDNILLIGSAKNGILDLKFHDVSFAKGLLGATGRFDFNNRTLEAKFSAENINADIASYLLFNLKHQITGIASADLFLRATGKLENLSGEGNFRILKGALPSFGAREFILNPRKNSRPKKFSLNKIVKIKNRERMKPDSTLTGNFKLDKTDLKDISLYMENKYVSLYLSGDYNMESEYGEFDIWGKYDKTIEDKIKIMHIPLSWIMKYLFRNKIQREMYERKLRKVPDIDAVDSKNFNVKIKGVLNKKGKTDVQFNSVQ